MEINPHKLPNVKLRSFWAIESMSVPNRNAFTPTEIANFLVDKAHIATTRQAVEQAFKAARGEVYRDGARFRLMQVGRDELASYDQATAVLIIEPGKPFSGKRIAVAEVLSALSGDVKVCDAYCGMRTLDVLSQIASGRKIRILTQQLIDKPTGSLKRALVDLEKEGLDIEVRVYSASTLHDRYIIDASGAWLSGNSLDNLGNKESLIVALGLDIRQTLDALFDSRWKVSQPV
jgi:hypothetical protein